jgi:hypothetical protein
MWTEICRNYQMKPMWTVRLVYFYYYIDGQIPPIIIHNRLQSVKVTWRKEFETGYLLRMIGILFYIMNVLKTFVIETSVRILTAALLGITLLLSRMKESSWRQFCFQLWILVMTSIKIRRIVLLPVYTFVSTTRVRVLATVLFPILNSCHDKHKDPKNSSTSSLYFRQYNKSEGPGDSSVSDLELSSARVLGPWWEFCFQFKLLPSQLV